MAPLQGKLALVTGAGTGIGKGIALAYARAGAAVVLHYAHSGKGAAEAVAEIGGAGGRARTVQGDLGRVDECRRVVAEAIDFLGGMDVLVNNAGVTRTVPFLETSEETYNEVMDLNMRGYYFCAQEAARAMLARGGGAILNLGSIHGTHGMPGHSVYAATKGAINAFSRELAVELAPNKIRVNCIAPGLIEVPRYFATMPDYTTDKGARKVPWGRVGRPEDVGHLAVFLASDAADFVTGQVIHIDGGSDAMMALSV